MNYYLRLSERIDQDIKDVIVLRRDDEVSEYLDPETGWTAMDPSTQTRPAFSLRSEGFVDLLTIQRWGWIDKDAEL